MKNFDFWRVLEPILLGGIANIIINYIFDPKNPDFLLNEFLVAFMFAFVVTEANRKINMVLDKKISWTHNFRKRFIYHLIYLTISLALILNVLGNIYLWIIGDGFHTLNELLIINLSVLILAFLLTVLKWATHFYNNWSKAEIHLADSTKKFDELKSEIGKSEQQIELLKNNNIYRINVNDIQLARIEYGIVWVYFETDNKGVYQGKLNNLKMLLPDFLFFQATRNTVLRKDIIVSISSATYGKIDVKLNEKLLADNTLTVSRPKASQFRKWYNSN